MGRVTNPALLTTSVTRGVCRWLVDLGYTTLTEFKLANRRRADIVGLNAAGTIIMVEVKSTAADYRSDTKWLEYIPYCDIFSFAVPKSFPTKIIPEDQGVLVADAHYAAILRQARARRLHAARRRALTLRFCLEVGQRLSKLTDPRF